MGRILFLYKSWISPASHLRMSDSPQAQPAAETPADSLPENDPEIAALLDFEPVPVRSKVNGWDADAQRAFIVLLATTGSKLRAARALGRNPAGIDRLLERADGAGFRAACDRAMALAGKRNGQALARGVAAVRRADPQAQAPGQVLNEYGEYEDEDSLQRRGEEAAESICNKLTNIRRLFLKDISGCPGKRAAFEILTDWPIDWEKAAMLEPQEEEPLRRRRMREPDMVLAAEAGWLGDLLGRGRNRWEERKAELKQELDDYHAEHGLPPIDWQAEGWHD